MRGPRRPCHFRQRDLTAAVKAMARAGVEISKIEIDATGKIVIIPGKAGIAAEHNEWDEVFDGTDQAQVR